MVLEFRREELRTVQEILEADAGPQPPSPLRESSPKSFGLEDVPFDRYTSREFQALEYEHLWPHVWQWACCEEDLAQVGNYVVYDIGDQSILIVRSADDRIQAFTNSCLHRGTQLKEGTGTCSRLICPFHGWTWKLDGSLASVPCRWDFPQVEASEFTLPEVRVEQWAGMVFVCLDPAAPPLLEILDVLPRHFTEFHFQSFAERFTVAHVSKLVPCNWKTALEAFLESYHVVRTHPQQLQQAGDVNTQYDVWENVSRMHTPMAVGSPHLRGDYDAVATYECAAANFFPGMPAPPLPDGVSPREAIAGMVRSLYQNMLGVDLTGAADAEVIDGVTYFVFPNWVFFVGAAIGFNFRFRPNGDDPDTSIIDFRMMLPAPPGCDHPAPPALKHLGLDEPFSSVAEVTYMGPILDQDVSNMPRVQRGMKAAAKKGATLADYEESRIRHFNQLLDRYLSR